MVHRFYALAGMTALALFVATGCGERPGAGKKTADAKAKKTEEKKGSDHHDDGPGPHGGVITHFAKYHGEFCVDHDKKEATFYILTEADNKAAAVKIENPMLSIKSPAFQVEMKAVPQAGEADGKSSRYVATHANFGKVQEFEGSFSGKLDGKAYSADFAEEGDDHAKKDEKAKK